MILIFILTNLLKNNSINNNSAITKTQICDSKFYDEIQNRFDYYKLFDYLSFNSDYNDVPVTEHYKSKFKQNLSELYKF